MNGPGKARPVALFPILLAAWVGMFLAAVFLALAGVWP